ncbi:hypothetical protein O181_052666 [Austropuccinia psidii MF-1]|uniref:Uncharacterized protein n=1 Tax=Austropuccinia psidii MF-1 TaxID=1389203 RepID=A0A9Q3HPG5_9BASI|nr:hypothetical protein [Austropuccinia psidii MF-1]
MTPTRSGSNQSINSNGSGPGNSINKPKGHDCQPRGEAQIEDARTSTSSQRLARDFDTLIEGPEADITAIPVVRPESFPTGNNRNRPVSIQELVYGSKAGGVGTSSKSLDRKNELISSSREVHGPRKDRGSSEGLVSHVLPETSPTDKSLVEKKSMLSEDENKKLAQVKDNSPVEAPQASTSKTLPQNVPKEGKKTPKNNQKGKKKAKSKWNKPYPQNYRTTKKEKTTMRNVFNMERTLMEFKNREEERMDQSFPKK